MMYIPNMVAQQSMNPIPSMINSIALRILLTPIVDVMIIRSIS